MNPFHTLMIILGVLVLLSIAYGYLHSRNMINANPFQDKHLLERGLNKPVLWLFYNDSEVNSRFWSDFGARSSRSLNFPFLNLCYESIVRHNGANYRVEVISGLAGLAEKLGRLPSGLQSQLPVNDAEMNWIRAAILAKYGGLFLTPSTVCLRGFGELPANQVVFFGTDMNETYAGPSGTAIPSTNAVWVPYPNHPMMKEWADVCFDRLEERRGGAQIRRDFAWDYVRFSSDYSAKGLKILVDPHTECGRKKDGKRLQLEDLLASGTDGIIPFPVEPHHVYVPFPADEMRDREMFGWFQRMSEEQIMESDLVVKYLLQ